MPSPLVAGNWKMNGLRASLAEARAVAAEKLPVELLLCPPFTLVAAMAGALAETAVKVGGQDCHFAASGAHTGDISAAMLADLGASHVIVGHSERRADHGESSALVKAKAEAALAAGLGAIVCIGETEAERDRGETLGVVLGQLADSLPGGSDSARLVVAYEPVWAIGTGRTPTLDDIVTVHGAIRGALTGRLADGAGVRILYGGSVKPGNAREILALPEVNGALVGGASLKASDFLEIARALP